MQRHRFKSLRFAAVLASAVALLAACGPPDLQKQNNELIAADKAFSARSAKDGPKAAYQAFLTSDAKILNQYSAGEVGIHDKFMQFPADTILTWEPSFVDLSQSGDLGYTWGRYTLTLPTVHHGNTSYSERGYYATVWKRDRFGHWKVVLVGMNADGQK